MPIYSDLQPTRKPKKDFVLLPSLLDQAAKKIAAFERFEDEIQISTPMKLM